MKTSDALVPPKPKEFVKTALIAIVLGLVRGEK